MGLTGVAMCYNVFDLTYLTESNVFDVVFSCLLKSQSRESPGTSPTLSPRGSSSWRVAALLRGARATKRLVALVGLAAGSADGMCKVGPQACSHGLAHLAFIVFWHLLTQCPIFINFCCFWMCFGQLRSWNQMHGTAWHGASASIALPSEAQSGIGGWSRG